LFRGARTVQTISDPLIRSREASDRSMAVARAATRAAPARRFLYLLIADGSDGHTLHYIDTWPLFAAGASPHPHVPPPMAMRPDPLPPPAARFDCRVRPPVLAPRPRRREDRRRRQAPPHRHLRDAHGDRASRAPGPEVRHVKWYGSVWAEAGGRL
jgi:hypothetical protein